MRLKGKAGFYPTVTCKEAFFSGLHAKHRGLTILSVHEITLDALCCFQNIVPCAHKEYIIAAGINNAHLQPFENAVDVALEKQ